MKVMILTGSAILLAGFFQMPATPPMKLGLWETSSSSQMKMTGMNFNMPPRTSKVRSCVTADSWSKNLGQPQGQSDCSVTGQSFSGNSFSADVSCKSGAKGHVTITWTSPTSSQSMTHIDMNNQGHAGTVDITSTAQFVSADCGSVKPGSPEIVH